MSDSPLLTLVHNASLLLAVALACDVLAGKSAPIDRQAPRQVFLGLFVGAIGIAIMMTPWRYDAGIVFDTRSVLLGITGLFAGLVPAAIAMAMTAAFRVYLGGAGVLGGVSLIVASGCIGLAWRKLRRRSPEDMSFGELYLLGIAIHVTMLALVFTLPWAVALSVLSAISLPVLVINPLATALLGTLLANWMRRHRLVRQLEESEERLRLALASANQGLWDLDVPTGKATVSAEYAAMLGYDPATFRETEEAWIERLHPDDREAAVAMFRDYVAGRLPEYQMEFRQRKSDGGWLWLLSKGSIIERGPSGAPRRMIGTHTDITTLRESESRMLAAESETSRLLAESERTRLALQAAMADLQLADDKLRSSEAFYRSLFENMNEGFAHCRIIRENGAARDFVYLRTNAAFERMRGLTSLAGLMASQAIPGIHEANPELLAAYDRVASSGRSEVFDTHIARIDKWFQVSVFCPQADHFVSVFSDVTTLKRAEIENRRQLDELRKWHDVTIGREDRVLQLKAEVNELLRRLGEPARYGIANPDRR